MAQHSMDGSRSGILGSPLRLHPLFRWTGAQDDERTVAENDKRVLEGLCPLSDGLFCTT